MRAGLAAHAACRRWRRACADSSDSTCAGAEASPARRRIRRRFAADAAAQEEGEWTIFWLTVAAVAFSFAAIVSAFDDIKDMEKVCDRYKGRKSIRIERDKFSLE